MSRNALVMVVCALVMVLCFTGSGALLPAILRQSEDRALRFTNVSVDNAPPFVALGTAIGALRGLIVDYLWIRVNLMKEQGLYYEIMADSELITKLQPRFAAVWAFHGHNMAYNLSVTADTVEERWEWVNAGIRLVRNEGLRYNPNDMDLHRELAFWFAHKIEGVADDAHLSYKQWFAKEWHMLLGEPPADWQQRIAWLKDIADAPETLDAAEERTPGVKKLVADLEALQPSGTDVEFKLDRRFLSDYTLWQAVTLQSATARALGIEQGLRERNTLFVPLDALAGNQELQPQWRTLLAHVRKRVLKDEYNMDPQFMYAYTRDLGPIDWRHGSAHALYWARRGVELGEGRIAADEVPTTINTERLVIQAMQELARFGRISFDPFSNELPGRFPEPRWVEPIFAQFEHLYVKYVNVRGAGPESFIEFLKNFMNSMIRQYYRAGETAKAVDLMNRMDGLFGNTYGVQNNKWDASLLDVFVKNETYDQYQAQPHLAPSDVAASLEYGFRAVGQGRADVFRDALKFARQVIEYFKTNSWNDYINKFGRGRISEIINGIEDSVEVALIQVLQNPTLQIDERRAIWAGLDRVPEAAGLKALVYDRVMPQLAQQVAVSAQHSQFDVQQLFPPPPDLEQMRIQLAERQKQREAAREADRARDAISRQ